MMIPGYTIAFKKILYPIYNKIIGRETFTIAKKRIVTQDFTRGKLIDLQFEKLKFILTNAAINVPFYRKKFLELGFNPHDMRSIKEFTDLDFFVTKAEVRSFSAEFISEIADRKKLTWHRTGGSTGEPLNFPTDPATNSATASAMVRALSWWNIEVGGRHAMFWGSPQFIVRNKFDRFKKLLNIFRNKLMNRLFISNYNLNRENISLYRKKIEYFKPEYIRGMPSSLYIFGKTILEQDGPLTQGAPKVIHSACEQLFDWQKVVIEKAFNARVLNTYGLSEVADIAYEAPCGNLHIMDEDVFVELKDFGLGELEIVVTQLNSTMSPLIRYRTSDLADSVETCDKCKLGLQVLKGLKGRAHDFIVAPDGRFLHGQLFTHLLVYECGVLNFQIKQIEINIIEVSLVISKDYDVSTEKNLTNLIKKYMGEVNVHFLYLAFIPLTISGKHRWVISEIAANVINKVS